MLKKISNFLISISDSFIAGALAIMMIIVFVNVILRYVFKTGTSWSEEAVRYLMIWISFLGIAITARRAHSSVGIEYFVNLFNKNNQKRIKIISSLICVIFAGYLFWSSFLLTKTILTYGQISSGLQIPMGPVYLIMPVSAFFAIIVYISNTYRLIIKQPNDKEEMN